MRRKQIQSSTSGSGCPGAICTDGHPYVWTWCLLWTRYDLHRSPIKKQQLGSDWGGHSTKFCPSSYHCCCPPGRWSPPVEQLGPHLEHYQLSLSETPRRAGTLCCCRHKQQQETWPQTEGAGETTLWFTGANFSAWWLSWGAISKPTPAGDPGEYPNHIVSAPHESSCRWWA